MIITDRFAARQIITTITTTRANVPKVTEAFERTVKLSQATGNLSAGPDALAAAVCAALEGDRDPAADPEVQRILTASQIANDGITQAIDAIAYHRFANVCRDHADAIVKAWRHPFNDAAATLTSTHQRIGDVPLEDTEAILRQGQEAAAAWSEAQTATATITTVIAGWQALADLTRLASVDRRHHVLRFADVDHDTWTAHNLAEQRLTPWQAVMAGLSLSLPTPTEYRARVAAIEEGDRLANLPIDQDRSNMTGRTVLAKEWVSP